MPVDIELAASTCRCLVALPIFLLLDWGLPRLGMLRLVWHEAPFEDARYAGICTALILLMGALY